MVIRDIVTVFATLPEHVHVMFREHAAEYKVLRANPRLPPIAAALAESWSGKKYAAFRVEGTTIVDVAEES